jgi:cysteinyl-tRNA synthetase
LAAATKKATLLQIDRVLGLRLAEWQPVEESVPETIQALAQRRQAARVEKRWREADQLRAEIQAAGYEVEDTPQGPRVTRRSALSTSGE